MKRWLPAFALKRPVTVFMTIVALLTLGLIAYARMPLQLMPGGFQASSMWVNIPFANATPREADELVARPISEEFSTLPSLKRMDSRASANSVGFSLEFHPSLDMAVAYNEVVERIERAMPDLPEEVDRYWIYKFDPDDTPIIWSAIMFPEGTEDHYNLLNKVIMPRLERISGVASIDAWGVDAKRLQIAYDRERMIAHGINLGEVQRKLQADNFQMSGGQFEENGRVQYIRSLSRFSSPEDLQDYTIRDDGLKLTDIADLRMIAAGDADINRMNGQDSAGLAISKESSANTVETSRAVEQAFEELKADPRLTGAEFLIFFNQGETIQNSLDTLQEAGIVGGLMAVVVLFVFLREWRMTLLIASAIPFSLLITLGVLYMQGESLNVAAMMGLMLAVGMVVDNAIVVVESIYRHRKEHDSVSEAAVSGTAEVALAILASTATTMVVFLPVILMTENATTSRMLGVVGLPVVYALAASLFMALLFAPLATSFVSGGGIREDARWLVWLRGRYEKLLRTSLRRPADTGISIIALMFLTMTITGPSMKCVQDGGDDANEVELTFTVPPTAGYWEKDDITRELEGWLQEHKEEWQIGNYRLRLRDQSTRGRMWAYLREDATLTRDEVVEKVREALPDHMPGVVVSVGWGQSANSEYKVELEIYGEDLDTLAALADEVARRARAVDGVLQAEVGDLAEGLPEIQVLPKAEALTDHGVTASDFGGTLAFALRGSLLEPIQERGKELEVETRLSVYDRSDIATLLDFPIWSQESMSLIPARSLADIRFASGPNTIRRRSRRTALDLTLDLSRDKPAYETMAAVNAALKDMKMPRGYSIDTDEWANSQQTENDATAFALGMSVVFVYLLMGVLFESWLLPLTILATLPLAGIGVGWMLHLTKTPFGTMAGIGLVVLVGVVVNNGIVLIDLITQLRREGMERSEAILEACQRRLRPILMTAATTIFGMVPMALGSSNFVGIPYAPMGRTVIGGLAASTALTLIVIPFLYVLLDDLRASAGRAIRRLWEKSA